MRTLLQHAWATLVHDHLYKVEFNPPAHLKREAARIMAKLEDTDESFTSLIEAVQFYRSCFPWPLGPKWAFCGTAAGPPMRLPLIRNGRRTGG